MRVHVSCCRPQNVFVIEENNFLERVVLISTYNISVLKCAPKDVCYGDLPAHS